MQKALAGILVGILFCLTACSDVLKTKVDVLPVSPKPVLVGDYAKILTTKQKRQLHNWYVQLQKERGFTIVAAIVPTIGESQINEYSTELFKKWGVGSKKEDNGLLIVLTMKEKKVRMETGYGTEGFIPDMLAAQIVEERMMPHLKKGNFYEALMAAGVGVSELALKKE